jgi:hypothetical protein
MESLLPICLFLVQASPPAVSPSPTAASGPVILFLVDNSASLPPLDPDEKRVSALEKMFSFLRGQPYRLILFGGRQEIFVDDVAHYRNDGQWTDFYSAFARAKQLVSEYPAGTDFRIILLTDANLDPRPADWQDMGVPPGEDLKAYVVRRTLALVGQLGIPLYVILIGEPPVDGVAPGSREQAPGFVLDMVRAANGARATPLAQTVSSFFGDDGLLLKKFIFRVAPDEGLKKLEPVVKRIVAPAAPLVEFQILSLLVLPLTLLLFLFLGILVRSFPGPGDEDVVELSQGAPVHLAADRLHRLESGGWGSTGLSLVADAKEASATLSYQVPSLDLTGAGLDVEGLDESTSKLLPLGLDELRRALESAADLGTKEEKIYALNLDYMAKNLDAKEAERILVAPATERRRISALEFLRAKAHLLFDDGLRRKLTAPRATLVSYGKEGSRVELTPGEPARIGRYTFVVQDLGRGGRKDIRVVLRYQRVPSLLGLKTVLPSAFQRAFRLRRSSHRIVS